MGLDYLLFTNQQTSLAIMKEIRKNKWSLSLNQFMVAMLCFLAFGLTGCQDSDKKLLEKTVEGVNEKCPIVVSPEIQIAKLELEEDYLTYYFDYSEQSYMLPDEIDASLKKELANQILNAISRFSGEEKEILDLLLKKEMGLKFVMDFKRSKKQITVKFTAKYAQSSTAPITLPTTVLPTRRARRLPA